MSELSMDEALLPVNMIRLQADGSPNYLRQALHQIADNFDAIRTALAGGGGAEKVERPEIIDADRVGETRLYMLSLESRLAAAEKRAEEARDAFTLVVGECDALKAELAEAKKRLDDAGMANARADAHAEDIAWYLARFNDLRRALELPPGVGLTRQDMYLDLFNGIRQEMRIRREFMAERDAALARVKELEDAMGRIHDVWMATDVNALNLALANMDIPTRVTT